MLIKEVIIKNFMSYEYARIPLRDGVNIVCGPNGAGKSSLLLAICVALGDTYTERSKKLSDLIGWEQDQAEVSLILDNSPRDDGKRPVPIFNIDEVRLARNLRRDGKYTFELNQRTVSKAEVVELLKGFGFDPDNMLIIMHQNMPGRFANLSPQERLVMFEEAVGFNTFRRDIVEAKQRLGGILSEEKSLNQLLDRARETLAYWREQNERLQEKKQLQTRMNFLQREMAWSKVLHLEGRVKELEQELDQADADLYAAEEEMNRFGKAVVDSNEALKQLRIQWMEFIERRVEAEKALGISEFSINSSKERIQSINKMLGSSGEQRKKLEFTAQTLRERLNKGPTKLDDYFNIIDELEKTQTETFEGWSGELITQRGEAESRIKQLTRQLSDAEAAVSHVTEDMEVIRVRIDATTDQHIEGRIQLALLKDKRGRLKRRIEELKAEIDHANTERRDAEGLVGPTKKNGEAPVTGGLCL